jgi:hypothetical protein
MMEPADPNSNTDLIEDGIPRSAFPPTRWSVVLRIQGEDPGAARHAHEDLCSRYWYPLYSFARRRGLTPEGAEDAPQTFFSRLISVDSLRRVDRDQGKSWSFLLGGMRNFLAEAWREENSQKRGGGQTNVPIDTVWAEERISHEASGVQHDDAYFDRIWAITLLDRVTERLRGFYAERDRLAVYDALKGCLLGGGEYAPNVEGVASLGLSDEGVRSAVHQLRQGFRR